MIEKMQPPDPNERPPSSPLTEVLINADPDDVEARRQAFEIAYPKLRRIAANQMRKCFNVGSLGRLTEQPTEILHNAYLPLLKVPLEFKNSGYFYAIATKLIGG